MAGEAQVPDPPPTLLLHKVIHNAPAGIGVGVDGLLVHIVQQVEVEIIHTTLPQLLLEDIGGVVARSNLMPGVLGGQVPRVPGIVPQHPADDPLRFAPVVGIGRVEVVHAVRHGVGGHGPHLVFVHRAVRLQRQPHGAEAQQSQPLPLKNPLNHASSSVSQPLASGRYRLYHQYSTRQQLPVKGCRAETGDFFTAHDGSRPAGRACALPEQSDPARRRRKRSTTKEAVL